MIHDKLEAVIRKKNALGAIDYFDKIFDSKASRRGRKSSLSHFCSCSVYVPPFYSSTHTDNPDWDEKAFTSFLPSLFPDFPPGFPALHEAADVLFRSVTSHATIPFDNDPSTTLSRATLLRGVATQVPAMNPLSHGHVRGADELMSRRWTPFDYHRHFFRSLMPPYVLQALHDALPLETNAPRDHDPTPAGPDDGFRVDVSYELPGLSDTLDALTHAQPARARGELVPRASLGPIATTLMWPNEHMDQFKIEWGDWFCVIMLALTLSLAPGAASRDEFADATRCLLRTFSDMNDDRKMYYISYQEWKRGITFSAVRL